MGELNTVKNGKGSKPRPANKKQFDNNFDLIDWGSKRCKYQYDHAKNRSKR